MLLCHCAAGTSPIAGSIQLLSAVNPNVAALAASVTVQLPSSVRHPAASVDVVPTCPPELSTGISGAALSDSIAGPAVLLVVLVDVGGATCTAAARFGSGRGDPELRGSCSGALVALVMLVETLEAAVTLSAGGGAARALTIS